MSAHGWSALFFLMPLSLCVGVLVAVVSAAVWRLPLYHSVLIGNAAGLACWLVMAVLPPHFFRVG